MRLKIDTRAGTSYEMNAACGLAPLLAWDTVRSGLGRHDTITSLTFALDWVSVSGEEISSDTVRDLRAWLEGIGEGARWERPFSASESHLLLLLIDWQLSAVSKRLRQMRKNFGLSLDEYWKFSREISVWRCKAVTYVTCREEC